MKWEGERKKEKKSSLHLTRIQLSAPSKKEVKVKEREKKEGDRTMINGRWRGNEEECYYLSASFFSAFSFNAGAFCCS